MTEIIFKRDLEGFNEILEEWIQLSNTQGHHFTHSPFWYQANLEHYPEHSIDCFFVCGYQKNDLVFVLPLEKKYLVNKTVGIFYLQLFYPNEMGVSDITCAQAYKADWPAVIKAIKKEFSLALFLRTQNILDDSHAINSQLTDIASYQKNSHEPCYLDFKDGYDAFLEQYSTKFKRNLRRLTKKATAEGELKLECVTEADQLQGAFTEFLDSEDSGWKGQAGSSVKKLEQLQKYYRHFIETYGRTGECQINLLKLDKEVIASQFCLKSKNTLYLLKIGFSDKHAEFSPGQLLIEQLVKKGTETKQFNRIHFVTEYQWMYRWKPSSQQAFLAYMPMNLLGRLIILSLKLKNTIKK